MGMIKKYYCNKCGIQLPSDIFGRIPGRSWEFSDGLYCEGCAKRRKNTALGSKSGDPGQNKKPDLLDL
jgi:hypothetical protein